MQNIKILSTDFLSFIKIYEICSFGNDYLNTIIFAKIILIPTAIFYNNLF